MERLEQDLMASDFFSEYTVVPADFFRLPRSGGWNAEAGI
jgi:hypothetical protein